MVSEEQFYRKHEVRSRECLVYQRDVNGNQTANIRRANTEEGKQTATYLLLLHVLLLLTTTTTTTATTSTVTTFPALFCSPKITVVLPPRSDVKCPPPFQTFEQVCASDVHTHTQTRPHLLRLRHTSIALS